MRLEAESPPRAGARGSAIVRGTFICLGRRRKSRFYHPLRIPFRRYS
ncbi:hypothetical protein CJF30_00009743 [Rutstroemia sp. NJR-2017a BBW]|nr:hypothetical protein CJF30_00009743 [Rutstroemia sp. NJR-2017a BBW]